MSGHYFKRRGRWVSRNGLRLYVTPEDRVYVCPSCVPGSRLAVEKFSIGYALIGNAHSPHRMLVSNPVLYGERQGPCAYLDIDWLLDDACKPFVALLGGGDEEAGRQLLVSIKESALAPQGGDLKNSAAAV